MEQLLKNEGILIEDDHIINFEEKFWDPGTELKKVMELPKIWSTLSTCPPEGHSRQVKLWG
jgi:hypothetical protein